MQCGHEAVAFGGQVLGQGRGARVVDQRLDAADRVGRFLGQVFGDAQRFSQGLPRRRHAIDDAEVRQARRIHRLAFHHDLAGKLARQHTRDLVRAATVRRQTDLDVGHHELGIAGGHDEIARQYQRESRAGGRALDRRDDRLGEGVERLDPLVEDFDAVCLYRRWLRTVAEQSVQIAAGTEHAIGTRQDHGTDRIVAGGDFERFRRSGVDVRMQRVTRFGVGDGQYERRVDAFGK